LHIRRGIRFGPIRLGHGFAQQANPRNGSNDQRSPSARSQPITEQWVVQVHSDYRHVWASGSAESGHNRRNIRFHLGQTIVKTRCSVGSAHTRHNVVAADADRDECYVTAMGGHK
jgi:hypothetical protein